MSSPFISASAFASSSVHPNSKTRLHIPHRYCPGFTSSVLSMAVFFLTKTVISLLAGVAAEARFAPVRDKNSKAFVPLTYGNRLARLA
jgi:hypothetical protein